MVAKEFLTDRKRIEVYKSRQVTPVLSLCHREEQCLIATQSALCLDSRRNSLKFNIKDTHCLISAFIFTSHPCVKIHFKRPNISSRPQSMRILANRCDCKTFCKLLLTEML